MQDPDQGELRRRLELLAPFLRDLGSRILESYAKAGILAAIPDNAFPVSDARFTRKAEGYAYHPHGPVYFNIARDGELELAGQDAGVPLTEAMRAYVRLARHDELEGIGPDDGATEWFPPPRFLLDTATSRLQIAAVARMKRRNSRTRFIPLEEYMDERARLFVEAFLAVR
jgi:hypothetical protein